MSKAMDAANHHLCDPDVQATNSILGLALEEMRWYKTHKGLNPQKWHLGIESFRQIQLECLIVSPFRDYESFMLLGIEVEIIDDDPWLVRLLP